MSCNIHSFLLYKDGGTSNGYLYNIVNFKCSANDKAIITVETIEGKKEFWKLIGLFR